MPESQSVGGHAGSLLSVVRIDFAPEHRQPRIGAWLLATVVSLAVSLAVDAALVAIGTHVFPSTRGFVHFHFSDYGKLTVLGVLVACLGWPLVTRISSAPRWVFFRSAILITLVLWLPDLYIFVVDKEPGKGVAVLMAMHLAIALVTDNALVRLAPIRGRRARVAS